MGVAEVESDASEAREHVRTLAHANTQLEAEVRMLRRTRDEHVGELASLRRAVGTATFERDAAAAQQQTQGEAAARTEETTMRQSQVIRELDEERLRLRGELERASVANEKLTAERDATALRLTHARESQAALQAEAAARADEATAALAKSDEATVELDSLRSALAAQQTGSQQLVEQMSERASGSSAQARAAVKELAAARGAAAEAQAARDAALAKLKEADSERQAAVAAAEKKYAGLAAEHELLLDAERSLRRQLATGGGGGVAARGGGGGPPGGGGFGGGLAGLEPEEDDEGGDFMADYDDDGTAGGVRASLAAQMETLEAESASRLEALGRADGEAASIGSGLAAARSEIDALRGRLQRDA